MRRREFMTRLGGAVAWPFAAQAQQPDGRVRRVGVLMGSTDEADLEGQARFAAFRQGLADLTPLISPD
jgi:putative tryptophan/tyrosine transport system substrate-binding protein